MHVFNHKLGSPLEKTALYNIKNQRWPRSFQGYENQLEGDYRKPVAVFWDFEGRPLSLNREQVAVLVTPTTPKQYQEYLCSAKTLVDWLSTKEAFLTLKSQSQAKCTKSSQDLLEGRCCPNYKDLDKIMDQTLKSIKGK